MRAESHVITTTVHVTPMKSHAHAMLFCITLYRCQLRFTLLRAPLTPPPLDYAIVDASSAIYATI